MQFIVEHAEWKLRLDALQERFAKISEKNDANLDGLISLPNYYPGMLPSIKTSILRQYLRLKQATSLTDVQLTLLNKEYENISGLVALIEGSISASLLRIQRRQAIREQAERQAQLHEDIRLRPVVFRPDPAGSINLRAFANDAQSVHRSSVQNSTHKTVVELLSRPAPPADQDTLPEIVGIFKTSTTIRWASPEARGAVVTELTDNYTNIMAFSISYGRVVDYIWAFICAHSEKVELIQRLTEELYEGRGMCSNGKMARLINVVQGYDESLENAAPRELFQQRMGELSSKPVGEREALARALFAEFRIPIAEHAAWLKPLLDA